MKNPSPAQTKSNKRKPYTHLACQMCKDKHLKCDGIKPVCGNCASKRVECHYRDERNRRRDLSQQSEEDLQEKIHKLQQEVNLWKQKYQSLKSYLHEMQITVETTPTWVPYEPPPPIQTTRPPPSELIIQEHIIEGNQVIKKRSLSQMREYPPREEENMDSEEMRYPFIEVEKYPLPHPSELGPPPSSSGGNPPLPYPPASYGPPMQHYTPIKSRGDFIPSQTKERRHSAPNLIPLPMGFQQQHSPEIHLPIQHPSSHHFPPSVSVPIFSQYYEMDPPPPHHNPPSGSGVSPGGGVLPPHPGVPSGYGGPINIGGQNIIPFQSEMFSSLVDAKPIHQEHFHQYYGPPGATNTERTPTSSPSIRSRNQQPQNPPPNQPH